jgi:hypothetical protein
VSTPHDHHFVPVFYLKQWAPNGKLIAYTRPRGAVFRKEVSPRATGYERDLYSFPGLGEELSHFLESVFLQQNDSVAAVALRKLIAREKTGWTSDLRSSWSRFLLGFLIRHPDPFAELKAAAYDHWLKPDPATKAEYDKIRRPEFPLTFEEYVESIPGLADKIRIRLLQAAMDNERLGTRLNAMIWDTIDVSASEDTLLTSDWPLDKNLPAENGHIAVPVGPAKLFVGVYKQWVLDELRRVPPKRLVHNVNKTVVARARRHVWSCDDRQRPFIDKHMSTHMLEPPFFPFLKEYFGNR